MEELEGITGFKFLLKDDVQAQIDAINPMYDELEEKIARIRQQLAQVQLNPGSTTEAQKLQREIALAEDKLHRLREEAAGTNARMTQLMNQKGTLREKINAVIARMRNLKTESGKTTL